MEPDAMITATVIELFAAWSDHQLTNRELVTEARLLPAEDRATLRAQVQATANSTTSTPATRSSTSAGRP